MVREDLVEGAIAFLQDPSVSSAPLEQRISFLRSKNLTQEEIDASLARVGQSTPTQAAAPPTQTYQPRQGQQPQYGGYQQYAQQQYWPQAPPEPPRRDWRDYFIMAVVTGGLGYGMYWTAKRYIQPLIAPPTPPQLEQDKASIDESFEKAFALLDQLATDTSELKESERARTEKLDNALAEVESVIGKMKEANEEREREAKRTARELTDIKDLIPKAIEREREGTDAKLKELISEMKSLKTLVNNRMSGTASPSTGPLPPRGGASVPSWQLPKQQEHLQSQSNGTPEPEVPGITDHGASAPSNNAPRAGTSDASANSASGTPDRSASSSPFTSKFVQSGRNQIPAWQRKRNEDAKKDASAEANRTAESGTVTEESSA